MMSTPTTTKTSEHTKTAKIYIRLAELIAWHENTCKHNNQQWMSKTEDLINQIMDTAPSGSGVDNGTQIRMEQCKPDKLVFDTAYHHMNEHGYYDGWTHHQVIIRPTFGGFTLKVTGRDKRDIKDYLGEMYDCWLHELTTT